MKLELPVVNTATRVELGTRCHRRHFLSDKLEYGKYKSPAAAFGNVIHAGAGAWWKWLDGEPLHRHSAMQQAVKQEWDRAKIESEKLSLEKAYHMMEAYTQQATLAGIFDGVGQWKVLHIEERLSVSFGGYTFRFQNDRALGEHESQRILLVDTKTTSSPSAKWRAGWSRSLQMKLYRKGVLQAYDNRETDILVEGLDKNVKPKVHYVVCPRWGESVLSEAVEQFKRISDADRELIERYQLPDGSINMTGLENAALTQTSFNYEDCYSYGSACQFLPLCDAEPEDRRGILHAEYEQIEQDY